MTFKRFNQCVNTMPRKSITKSITYFDDMAKTNPTISYLAKNKIDICTTRNIYTHILAVYPELLSVEKIYNTCTFTTRQSVTTGFSTSL